WSHPRYSDPSTVARTTRARGRRRDENHRPGERWTSSPSSWSNATARPLAVFGGATALWPLAGAAQQRRVPTVGVLAVGSPGVQDFWRLFREGMQELGYTEGQSIHYEFRSDEGQVSRLPELAVELVRLNVDVIVTWFTPAAQAAKRATSEIPIVMALVGY